MENKKKKWPGGVIAAFAVAAALGIIINTWIIAQLREPRPRPVPAQESGPVLPADTGDAVVHGEVTRVTQLDPNRVYDNNIIYLDGERTAAFKSNGFKIFDLEGEIPDGKIKFADHSRSTKGTEYFRNGQRHGVYMEFYNSGEARQEVLFEYGQMVQLKEFSIDGRLRMEIDYRDGLAGTEDGETGVGKVYYRDGTLRYEWRLTNQGQQRYKRAYNTAGKLVQEKTYDSKGGLVGTSNY